MKINIYILFTLLQFNGISLSLTGQNIVLPEADKTGGKPLMQVLTERQSIRSYTKDTLTQQQLSDLLWAGWGINRADQKKRTAPSSKNVQEIDLYVVMTTGIYLYDAEANILNQINNKDLRKLCGNQAFVTDAALNIIYVADLGKLGKKEGDEIKDSDLQASYTNSGFIAQNIYLYCASADLGCVVRAMGQSDQLFSEMRLRSNQRIILAQTVGVPQKQ
jgi:nitroreductase